MSYTYLKEAIETLALQKKVKSREFTELANLLDEQVCSYSDMPDGLFEVYMYILSNSAVFLKNGAHFFMSGFRYCNGFKKSTAKQREHLLKVIKDNCRFYREPNFCASVASLVVFSYPPEVSVRFFTEIYEESIDDAYGFIVDGLADWLMWHRAFSSELTNTVDNLLIKIKQARKSD